MDEALKLKQVEEKITTIRNQNVILDSDVAELYKVETREINQAVKNNPNKFPKGYIISLDSEEWENLKSKILISNRGFCKFSTTPKNWNFDADLIPQKYNSLTMNIHYNLPEI
jgi:hypothetical protein